MVAYVSRIFEFILNTVVFNFHQGPKVLCVICEKEGHLKMNCPDDTMPELQPLPAMTKEHLKFVTEVMKQVPSKAYNGYQVRLTTSAK
jgi:hypothetical protein